MIRRNTAITISFPILDTSNRPSRKSGISFSTGDVKISKDGASYGNTTNQPTEIGSTGRYKLDLTATEMDAQFVHVYVSKSGNDDFDQLLATTGHPSGTAITGTLTTTAFTTSLTSAVDDFWKNTFCLFTTGSLAGQCRLVTGYTGSSKTLSFVTAWTAAPSNTDRFIIVNI